MIEYMPVRNNVALIMFTILAIFFVFTALLIHPFGTPYESKMDDYIIMNTQNETGTNSGVTTIVFDYRGFDTLGEATILFAAVSGVLMIFRRVKK
jgi:multisubunit Na+/H+ antiporter MnhB subunit